MVWLNPIQNLSRKYPCTKFYIMGNTLHLKFLSNLIILKTMVHSNWRLRLCHAHRVVSLSLAYQLRFLLMWQYLGRSNIREVGFFSSVKLERILSIMVGKAWQWKCQVASHPHRPAVRQRNGDRKCARAIEPLLSPYQLWYISWVFILSKTVSWVGDQVFKCMSLWGDVLVTFISIWHKLESLERRELQLRKCLRKIRLQGRR